MSTVPETVTRTEPSTASIADAPGSVYVDPSIAVSGLFPFKEITGPVVSGAGGVGVDALDSSSDKPETTATPRAIKAASSNCISAEISASLSLILYFRLGFEFRLNPF